MEAGNRAELPQQSKAVHVLVFPFPLQGHVNSMLRLAELLSLAGLHVTFLNTDRIHDRLFCRFSGANSRLSRRPGFRFRSIPDGLPGGQDHQLPLNLLGVESAMKSPTTEAFRGLLMEGRPGQEDSEGGPPVTCVVVDGLMPFATEVAEGVGIPAIAFRTASACSFWAFFRTPNLIESGELPLPDDADLDHPIHGIPGTESFLRRRDLPSFLREARDATDNILQMISTVTNSTKRARALILNTMESLESPVLSHIRTHFPITYTPGPLHALLKSLTPGQEDGRSMSANFWEEDRSCMAWLDDQPDKSVVYVSFGSIVKLTRDQLLEFWHGLVNSGQRFLWVVRPDLVQGTDERSDPALPEDLERGRLVGWAPQEEVLAHPAVSCFLTHGGWNSMMESMVKGVPMVCWPRFADQQMNTRFVGEVWKVGVDMKDTCERGVVERMVREVAGSEEVRKAAREMAEEMRRSVAEGGSSYAQFQRLVKDITSWSLQEFSG